MERLLASQMSQGPLIEQKVPGANHSIFVPAQDAAPQPVPKLRGMHHPSYVRSQDRTRGQSHGHLTYPIDLDDLGDATISGSNADAQPPPRPWTTPLQTWMQTHPPLQLN